MNGWQQIIVSVFGVTSLTLFLVGFYQTKYKKNAFGNFYPLNLIGAFVWGDAVVFGIFWSVVSAIVLARGDFILFLLVFSVFWLVRSAGEAIYQLLQQFSTKELNSINNFPFLKSIFHNESMWFAYQIYWQCITVTTLLFSIYFVAIWLKTVT